MSVSVEEGAADWDCAGVRGEVSVGSIHPPGILTHSQPVMPFVYVNSVMMKMVEREDSRKSSPPPERGGDRGDRGDRAERPERQERPPQEASA